MTIEGLGPHGERASAPERVLLLPEDKDRARAGALRVAVVLHTTASDWAKQQIAGIVGGLTYVPKALPNAEVILDDLVLDWFTIEPGAAAIGKTIRELQARTATGASIVSLVEPDHVKRTNPEADTVLNEGAILILAGDRKTIAAMKRLLIDGKA